MSAEKNKKEALRWLTTAHDDLDAAQILFDHAKFALSCFHSQQAGEKAVKALCYYADIEPWGHSIRKIIEDLNQQNHSFFVLLSPFIKNAISLDRFYIPTRYPDGLPDISPKDAYVADDSSQGIALATSILDCVDAIIKNIHKS